MKNRVKKIIEEEAAFLTITPEKFRQFAERGCQIAFRDDLETRIDKFGGEELEEDYLIEIILSCAYGGAIEELVSNLN